MKLLAVLIAGWALLYLEGLLYQHFWRKGLSAHLTFTQTAAVEGDTAQLTETVVNRKFIPLPVLHVKFQMGRHLVFAASRNFKITDQNYRSDIFSCMPWQEIRRTLDFSCEKRGYYRISSVSLVSYDLFFLRHCVTVLPEDTALYVYPRPVDPLRLELPLKNLLGQILARQALLRDPFETQSVRSYQSFDPFKSVNWKATAHTGELKVNVYTPASSQKVTILLDMESDRIWTDEDLTEEAVRLCGSMAEYMTGMGIPVAVYSNGTDCLTGLPSCLEAGAGKEHLRSIMELLARVKIVTEAASAHGAPGIPSAGTSGAVSGMTRSNYSQYAASDAPEGTALSRNADPVSGAPEGAVLSRNVASGFGAADAKFTRYAASSSGALKGTAFPRTTASASGAPEDPALSRNMASGFGAADAGIAGEKRRVPMEELLSYLTDHRGGFASDTALYVMISPGQRQSLTDAFDALCLRSPGSQWILPCRPGDRLRTAGPRLAQFYRWEVSYVHA